MVWKRQKKCVLQKIPLHTLEDAGFPPLSLSVPHRTDKDAFLQQFLSAPRKQAAHFARLSSTLLPAGLLPAFFPTGKEDEAFHPGTFADERVSASIYGGGSRCLDSFLHLSVCFSRYPNSIVENAFLSTFLCLPHSILKRAKLMTNKFVRKNARTLD